MRTVNWITLAVAGLAMVVSGAVAAENLCKSGNGEDADVVRTWGRGVSQNTTDKHSGAASMETAIKGGVFSPEFIAIDPAKNYRLSGWFKLADKTKPSRALFGVRFYDASRKEILCTAILPEPGTAAQLAADARKGDTVLTVTGTWTVKSQFFYGIAFNVKDDLSDLPTPETMFINKIEAKGTSTLVTVSEPLDKDYPAGTKVRQHRYVDYPTVNFAVAEDWMECSLTFAGQGTAYGQIWPGAKFVRIEVVPNLDRREDLVAMRFDDISFTEVAK